MTAAQKIDKILKDRGLSRRQLAIKAEIPPSTLQSALERNKEIPLSMLTSVADALEVNVYYVIGDEELQHFGGEGVDVFNASMQIAQEENNLINQGLAAFLKLNSYTVTTLEGKGEGIFKVLDSIKHTYSVQDKDGNEIVLSASEMNRLGNEISDMVEIRMKYLFMEFKGKGANNG